MNIGNPQLEKAREAYRVANDLHLDLITGTEVYRFLRERFRASPPHEIIEIGVQRLCLFNVFLSLSKWIEYYDHYKAILPKDAQRNGKNLRKQIINKGIKDFRDNVVGHIWDDKTKQALTVEETEKRIRMILEGDDIDIFMNWVNDPTNNSYPYNVITIVEHIRDWIAATYDCQ